MIDKRKFIRLKVPIKIVYRIVKKNKRARTVETVVVNISCGGIRILAKDDLRAGDLLNIEIQIPHFEEPIEAIAEVVWFGRTKSEDSELREAGLRFRDIHPRDMHRILEYVHLVGIG